MPCIPDDILMLQSWPETQTQNVSTCSEIFASLKPSVIRPYGVCNSQDPASFPYLLIFVTSAVPNKMLRMAIRKSWGNTEQDLLKSKVKVVFLVGRERRDTHQQDLVEESKEYGDILQEGFIDTYANLSIKSVVLLQWFSLNCNNSVQTKYVLKTDDDMFVNIPNLYSFVQSNTNPDLLIGHFQTGVVPIRDPASKWFAPRYLFQEDTYPDYLSGGAYVMHYSVVQRLYHASLDTPFMHIEDVFVTGVLRQKIGINPIGSSRINVGQGRKPTNPDIIGTYFTMHLVGEEAMVGMYTRLINESNMSDDQ